MTIITGRDFRANQSKYIDMVHRGEDVILRSRAGNVRLVPDYGDNEITPQLQAKIDKARREWREGKCVSLNTHKGIDDFFQSL